MIKRTIRVVAVLALTAVTGCANLTVGKPIDQGKVATIVPGRTTRDQVKDSFGPPLHTVNGPDGDILVWRYLNGRGTIQELCVSLNGDTVSVFSHE